MSEIKMMSIFTEKDKRLSDATVGLARCSQMSRQVAGLVSIPRTSSVCEIILSNPREVVEIYYFEKSEWGVLWTRGQILNISKE